MDESCLDHTASDDGAHTLHQDSGVSKRERRQIIGEKERKREKERERERRETHI